METANDARSRRWLSVAILAVIALGLASRKCGFLLPDVFGNHPGDALWALALFLGFAFLKPAASRERLAFFALLTAYCVEFAQLYRAPWIMAIRANPIGHLALGSTFVMTDLLAYAIGIGCGFLLLPLVPSSRLVSCQTNHSNKSEVIFRISKARVRAVSEDTDRTSNAGDSEKHPEL